jgi:hypothetical protein
MSELMWLHQSVPRPLDSIADAQVRLWELRQLELKAEVPVNSATPATEPDRSRPPNTDRFGIHYWGEAIVDEFVRLMHVDEKAEAFFHEGIVGSRPESAAALPASPSVPGRQRRSRRHGWLRRSSGKGRRASART